MPGSGHLLVKVEQFMVTNPGLGRRGRATGQFIQGNLEDIGDTNNGIELRSRQPALPAVIHTRVEFQQFSSTTAGVSGLHVLYNRQLHPDEKKANKGAAKGHRAEADKLARAACYVVKCRAESSARPTDRYLAHPKQPTHSSKL